MVEPAHVHLLERKSALLEAQRLENARKEKKGALRADGLERGLTQGLRDRDHLRAALLRGREDVERGARGLPGQRVRDDADPGRTERSAPAVDDLAVDQAVVDPREEKRHVRKR